MQRIALVLAFFAGACATTAVTTVASESSPNTASATAEPAAAGAPGMGNPDEPRVVALTEAEQRQPPTKKASIWLLARGHNAFVGKLELAPSGAVPEHRDATEEYLHILEGSGKLMIDDTAYDVGPGTTIYMPANAKVSYQNGDQKLVALQVFAGPEPAAKYDGWPPVN